VHFSYSEDKNNQLNFSILESFSYSEDKLNQFKSNILDSFSLFRRLT